MGLFEKITASLDTIDNEILELVDGKEFTSLIEVKEFRKKYKDLVKRISDISEEVNKKQNQLTPSQRSDLDDRCTSSTYDLDWVYDERSIYVTEFLLTKTEENEQALRNTQGMQLTVFSIVLTILAFVLTNAKILAATEINFKNVLLVNISYLLSADIFFSFIYIFIGPIFHRKSKWMFISFMILMPIFLIVALVLVALFLQ